MVLCPPSAGSTEESSARNAPASCKRGLGGAQDRPRALPGSATPVQLVPKPADYARDHSGDGESTAAASAAGTSSDPALARSSLRWRFSSFLRCLFSSF